MFTCSTFSAIYLHNDVMSSLYLIVQRKYDGDLTSISVDGECRIGTSNSIFHLTIGTRVRVFSNHLHGVNTSSIVTVVTVWMMHLCTVTTGSPSVCCSETVAM